MNNQKLNKKSASNQFNVAKFEGAEYIELYEQHREAIKRDSSELMNAGRDQAFDEFRRLGFPTNKLEKYKYTDLRVPLSVEYSLNGGNILSEMNPSDILKSDVPIVSPYLYYLVNDSFHPISNENSEQLPQGVIVESLRSASEKYPELVKKYYNRLAGQQNDSMVAFNSAFAKDGFFIYVPENVVMKHPIQIVDTLASKVNFMANGHNLVVVEKGAECRLVVCDHTLDKVHFFANRVTEVFVGENAQYEHYKLENVHDQTTILTNLLINQAASSNVLANILTLHNGFTRNTIEIDLDGENCETMLCGVALCDKNQHADNYTSILHNKPHCHSTELFKYVMDDSSYAGFTGRLLVAKDAQKTQAYQTNRNVLLTKEAKVRTRPQLEIFADDVKCSHGATIGQLDESMTFYMRQRGIPEKEAKLLLMFAFAAEVLEDIRIDAFKDEVKLLVEKRLRGKLN
ncbi:MAG: Fe-S cluster assembly protein SufD [Paludibacteraceae bacterium]